MSYEMSETMHLFNEAGVHLRTWKNWDILSRKNYAI
jgi:hypothetical protein